MLHPSEAGATLRQLKTMLYYMLYECEQDFVSLKDEIDFVESYTTLEKIRNKSSDLNVRFQVKGTIDNQSIAPLLLINFIENAFKHGVKSNIDSAFVHISIDVNGNDLRLIVFNSKPHEKDTQVASMTDGGIGIENVRKRLSLLYPDRYQLELDTQVNSFSVALNLQLY